MRTIDPVAAVVQRLKEIADALEASAYELHRRPRSQGIPDSNRIADVRLLRYAAHILEAREAK